MSERDELAAILATDDAADAILASGYREQGAVDVEWAIFRRSDGENGTPVENLRYSTKAGAQESINTGYNAPEFWEPRWRVVGKWTTNPYRSQA